jgi:large subunit ribosomal protein L21
MTKIAVIKTGGKQYKVKEGQTIKIEKIDKKEGEKIAFETLMIADTEAKDVNIGTPILDKKIEGKVIEHSKNKKITVVKYKNKTRYKRTLGHKQPFSKVEITRIA